MILRAGSNLSMSFYGIYTDMTGSYLIYSLPHLQVVIDHQTVSKSGILRFDVISMIWPSGALSSHHKNVFLYTTYETVHLNSHFSHSTFR